MEDQNKDHEIVGERDEDNSGLQSLSEEKDATRIRWLQWLACKSKLITEKPNTTTTSNIEKKTNKNTNDPLLSLLSVKLKFPGNHCFRN